MGIEKIKAKMLARLTEVILAALLTVAIGVFSYSLKAQSTQALRLRECETTMVQNTERIDGGNLLAEERTEALKESMEKSEKSLLTQINLLMKRVDQRYDSLEALILTLVSQ